MQQQHNIDTPEFWEQVKSEYKPEANLREPCSFCAICPTFYGNWWYGSLENKLRIRESAEQFLKTGEYPEMAIGALFLFTPKYNRDYNRMIAVRRAFIDYMLEKTSQATNQAPTHANNA